MHHAETILQLLLATVERQSIARVESVTKVAVLPHLPKDLLDVGRLASLIEFGLFRRVGLLLVWRGLVAPSIFTSSVTGTLSSNRSSSPPTGQCARSRWHCPVFRRGYDETTSESRPFPRLERPGHVQQDPENYWHPAEASLYPSVCTAAGEGGY